MKADAKNVVRHLKTVRGQIDGLIKMIEEDRYCIDISNQILASSALLKKANHLVLSAHMDHCMIEAIDNQDHQKVEELKVILKKLL